MKHLYLFTLFMIASVCNLFAKDGSVYTQKPNDPEAHYFTSGNYKITAGGKTDVSDVLQQAINNLKQEEIVADGQIYIFDKDGNQKGVIDVPERPSTIVFGGSDNNTLFITAHSGLYCVRIR